MLQKLLITSALLVAAATPAHAVLQIALQVGPDAFFCADNTACDTNAAVGTIQVGDQLIDGIQVNGSVQESNHSAPFPSINTSSLNIDNTLSTTTIATVAVGDTGFPAVAATFTSAGSGVWQGPGGSSIAMGWFVDPANAQGADTAFDTPGTQIDSFSNASLARTSAFAHDGNFIMTLAAPFSMTLQSTLVLAPGEQLVNRGQALVTSEVPEPSTWAMMLLGAAGMVFMGARRARKNRLSAFA